MFHKNGIGPIIRANGKIFWSLLYLNSTVVYIGLKYVYSVISVFDKRLPGNTKKWTIARSWPIRVRFLHPWAVSKSMAQTRAKLREGSTSVTESLASAPLFVRWQSKLREGLDGAFAHERRELASLCSLALSSASATHCTLLRCAS